MSDNFSESISFLRQVFRELKNQLKITSLFFHFFEQFDACFEFVSLDQISFYDSACDFVLFFFFSQQHSICSNNFFNLDCVFNFFYFLLPLNCVAVHLLYFVFCITFSKNTSHNVNRFQHLSPARHEVSRSKAKWFC